MNDPMRALNVKEGLGPHHNYISMISFTKTYDNLRALIVIKDSII